MPKPKIKMKIEALSLEVETPKGVSRISGVSLDYNSENAAPNPVFADAVASFITKGQTAQRAVDQVIAAETRKIRKS